MTIYKWMLKYDDGATETVRAATSTRAVARRTRRMLPQSVSSAHLAHKLREQSAGSTPLLDRIYGPVGPRTRE